MWKKAPLRDKKDTFNVVTPLQHTVIKYLKKVQKLDDLTGL